MSIFANNYEQIRQILHVIYTYGCYDVNQILSRLGVQKKTYTNRLDLLRYIWPNIKKETQGTDVNYFPFDRYTDENYLWRSYQLRTFNKQDINLYFFLLSKFAAKDGKPLCTDEILEYLDDKIFEDDTDRHSHRHMVDNKLKEMNEWGLLESSSQTPGFYRIAHNVLDDFSEEELLALHDLLYLYRDVLPLSSVGYFLQQEIRDYLLLGKGAKEVLNQRTFLTKDIFLQTIINDEIVFTLYQAMENDRQVTFSRGKKTIEGFSPWRLIFDYSNGRQYIWGLLDDQEAIYRLDKIQIHQGCMLSKRRTPLPAELLQALDFMWSAAVAKNVKERHAVVLKFSSTDPWRLMRLTRQVRHGKLIPKDDGTREFQIEVRNPRELLPWIRSWMPYISISALDSSLVKKMRDDWQSMGEVYEKKALFKSGEPNNANIVPPKLDEKQSPLTIFSEYRNVYYTAVREVYYRMVLEGETFDEDALVTALCRRAGVQDTKLSKKDAFRQEMASFGGEIKKISLFRPKESGVYAPAVPEEDLLPILLGRVEKRYLHTLLCQKPIIHFIGKKRGAALCKVLDAYPPFVWSDILVERGRETADELSDNKLFDNFMAIREAIGKGGCLSYENHTSGHRYVGVCKPYRIMFSPKTGKFQVITAAYHTEDKNARLVLMNLTSLSALHPVKDSLAAADVEKMLKDKRTLSIELTLRNLPENGNSDVERAFLLFSTHTKRGRRDKDGLYHLWIDAYDFEREEMIGKILSLGKAVEVVSPLNLRNTVAKRIQAALYTF